MILKDKWLEDDRKKDELGEVLTTKEVERLYNLPINTVVQDIRRGKVDYQSFRQSGKIWLITRAESNRLYAQYERTRGRNKESHVS